MEIGNSGFWLGKFKNGYVLWNNQRAFEFTAKNLQEAKEKAKEIIDNLQLK